MAWPLASEKCSLVSSPLTLVVSVFDCFRSMMITNSIHIGPAGSTTRIDHIHVMRCCHWDIWSITTSCLWSVTTDFPKGWPTCHMPEPFENGRHWVMVLVAIAVWLEMLGLHRVFLRSHWGHHAEHVFLVIRVIVMSPECEDLTCLRQGSSF